MNDEWKPFEDTMELKVFPCLSDLTLKKWHKNLYEYLQSTPFIAELVLENHNQRKLDFSKPSVRMLSVDMTGVEELILNEGLEELTLLGEVMEGCNIQANGKEKTLLLNCDKVIPNFQGLKGLGKLYVMNITEFDIEEILNAYPKITELRLWGNREILFILIRYPSLRSWKFLQQWTCSVLPQRIFQIRTVFRICTGFG